MTGDQRVTLKNGVMVYPFASFDDLLNFASDKNKLLVAVNAEKILHATDQTRYIINRNIGYCDGIGAVMALKKHGCKDIYVGCTHGVLSGPAIERLEKSDKIAI